MESKGKKTHLCAHMQKRDLGTHLVGTPEYRHLRWSPPCSVKTCPLEKSKRDFAGSHTCLLCPPFYLSGIVKACRLKALKECGARYFIMLRRNGEGLWLLTANLNELSKKSTRTFGIPGFFTFFCAVDERYTAI